MFFLLSSFLLQKKIVMDLMYPMKFKPVFKEKIWGGQKIRTVLHKDFSPMLNCGETWELASFGMYSSVIRNGFFKDTPLTDIIETYMGDLVGDSIYDKYGNFFPLLFKFIDADDDLSIQVHPNDDLAKERHQSYGKSEMWYVINAEKNSTLISGFNKKISQKEYLSHLKDNTLKDVLNFEPVNAGDVFDIPAGRVHAIGKGILLAEIQQASDVTYRIYDWNRKDKDGKYRELHTEQALDAIDFTYNNAYKTQYNALKNKPFLLNKTPYFTVNKLSLNTNTDRNFELLDSFVVYMCVQGNGKLFYNDDFVLIETGDTILIPNIINNIHIVPTKNGIDLLETYIQN